MRWLAPSLLAVAIGVPLGVSTAEEALDLTMVTRIREEGFSNSRVMETARQLTDALGPRLTGSPRMREANEWTRKQLESWGLANARLESWGPFGRGWSLERVAVNMVAPHRETLIALPKAWTPGTTGAVRGPLVRATLRDQADLDKNKGKLAGAIVLLAAERTLSAPEKPLFRRYSEDELEELAKFEAVERTPFDREEFRQRSRFQKKLREFLAAEKALATIEPSERDGGVVRVMGGGSRRPGDETGPLALVMAAEHYNRLARLLEDKQKVELELDVQATFHDQDLNAYNTVADIPGTDKAEEVVMLGAHLDSWHAGTGATDNAAGCAVAMEAVRILKALGVKPRRTVRIALWTGEEQGLIGSRSYVQEHLAARQVPSDPVERDLGFWRSRGPFTVKPAHAKFSAYFNLDNGTGRIRGIWGQGNKGALPILERWGEPLKALGWKMASPRSVAATDHSSFDAVGLPGFQFIQERLEYNSRSHHSNMDTFDRVQKADAEQQGVVAALFAWQAANWAEKLPRKIMAK